MAFALYQQVSRKLAMASAAEGGTYSPHRFVVSNSVTPAFEINSAEHSDKPKSIRQTEASNPSYKNSKITHDVQRILHLPPQLWPHDHRRQALRQSPKLPRPHSAGGPRREVGHPVSGRGTSVHQRGGQPQVRGVPRRRHGEGEKALRRLPAGSARQRWI